MFDKMILHYNINKDCIPDIILYSGFYKHYVDSYTVEYKKQISGVER